MAEGDLPYQQVPQVEQLRQERANAQAYGQTDRVAAVDKQLATLGAAGKRQAAAKPAGEAEAGADEAEQARRTPPQGRSTRPKQQA